MNKSEQMYKIYINDTPLRLVDSQEVTGKSSSNDRHIVARYPGKAKFLMNYIDMLEKTQRFDSVTIFSDDLPALFRDFSSLFTEIRAAGGIVNNSEGRLLFIYRRGSWDLPKGKIDPGETVEQAALREVREETGLQRLELGPCLGITYHCYRDKHRRGRRALKKTFWYRMHTPEQELVPQTEEEIEIATWLTIEEFWAKNPVVYGNIRDLLLNYDSL